MGVNPLYDESLPKIEENRRKARQNEGLKRLERLLEHFRDKIGVLSLTADPANAVMWAHYADQSRGVCVGIEFDHPFFESCDPHRTVEINVVQDWRARIPSQVNLVAGEEKTIRPSFRESF